MSVRPTAVQANMIISGMDNNRVLTGGEYTERTINVAIRNGWVEHYAEGVYRVTASGAHAVGRHTMAMEYTDQDTATKARDEAFAAARRYGIKVEKVDGDGFRIDSATLLSLIANATRVA